MVERLVWDQDAAGSNPVTSTKKSTVLCGFSVSPYFSFNVEISTVLQKFYKIILSLILALEAVLCLNHETFLNIYIAIFPICLQ